MTVVQKALQDIREAQAAIKQAYQPMSDPAAGAPPMDPSQQTPPPQPAAPAGAPPVDPAVMAQAMGASAPPAGAPPQGAAIDPQMVMELMSSLEQVATAMQQLGSRVDAQEKELRRLMHELAKSQGEQALLLKLMKEQSPMGPEVAGSGMPDPSMLQAAPIPQSGAY